MKTGYKPIVFERQGKIIGAIFCCYNPISKLDMRVEVQIPGSVRVYFVTDKEGKCLSLEQMRQKIIDHSSESTTQQNLSKVVQVKIEEKIHQQQQQQQQVKQENSNESIKPSAVEVKITENPIENKPAQPEIAGDTQKPQTINDNNNSSKPATETIEELSTKVQDLSEKPAVMNETQPQAPKVEEQTIVNKPEDPKKIDPQQQKKDIKLIVSEEEELFEEFYLSSFLRYSQFPIWSRSLSLYGIHVLDINDHQYWKKHSTWKYYFEKKIMSVAKRCFQNTNNNTIYRKLWELNDKINTNTENRPNSGPSTLGDVFSQFLLGNGYWNQALEFFSEKMDSKNNNPFVTNDFSSTYYQAKTLFHLLRYFEADQLLTKKISELSPEKDKKLSIPTQNNENNSILDLILLEMECLLTKEKDKSIKSQNSVSEKLNLLQKTLPIAEYLTTLSSAAMSLCGAKDQPTNTLKNENNLNLKDYCYLRNQTRTYLAVAKVFLFLGQFENCLWTLNSIPLFPNEADSFSKISPKKQTYNFYENSEFRAFYLYDDFLIDSITAISYHNYDIAKKMSLSGSEDNNFEKKYFNLSQFSKKSIPKWLFFESISNNSANTQVFSALSETNKEIQEKVDFENKINHPELLALPANQLKGITKEIYAIIVDLYHAAGSSFFFFF